MHANDFIPAISRRDLLKSTAVGFGGLALAADQKVRTRIAVKDSAPGSGPNPIRRGGAGLSLLGGTGVRPCLGFAEAMQEERVVRDRLFDQLLKEEQLRAVDDGTDTLLESLFT